MGKEFSKTTLPSGVRVVSEYTPSVGSVSIGIWVHVGSRDEKPELNGLSHLIEHMLFRGTKNRTAFAIAQELESLGGSINAFTSREHTCYYVRVLHNHLPKAMEILGDILNNSLLSPRHLVKEKQVILEEIKDVTDSPDEYVHDLFAEQMWSGHPLGQPITGRAASVSSMRRSTVIDYIGDFYQAPNMVVAAAGLVPHRVLVELTKKHFRRTSKLPARNDSHPQEPGFSIKAVKNHTKQTHVCIGFPSLDFADRQRYALLAINALLSGGMSSRLFQSVREKAGYCYNIYSYQEFFHDTGMFCVYFSADGKYVVRASRLVLTELRRLREKLLGRSEVAELKNQLKGGLMLSQESMYNRMNRIARQELMTQSYLSLSEACRHIDAVTPREIRDTANRVFDSARLTCCSLGGTRRQELDGVRWSIL